MALIIEDGTIVIGAESYATVAEANIYHANRGNSAWTGEDAVKEAALRKAATYLDGEYRRRWKGYRVQPLVQAMEWPRTGVCVVDELGGVSPYGYFGTCFLTDTTIPQRIKDAQCELALRALAGELAPDTQGKVKRETVDVLTTEWFEGSDPSVTTYRIVVQLLSDLLRPKGSIDVLRG